MYNLVIILLLNSYIYLQNIFQKLPTTILALVCLNNFEINIAMLLYVSTTFYLLKFNRIYFGAVLLSVITWKLKHVYFIKFFFLGFFKTHLLILYTSILLIRLLYTNNFIFCRLKQSYLMYLFLLAFFLGGRWALYLYNWGYYWTNDSIEFLLLIFTLLLLHKLHKVAIGAHFSCLCLVLCLYSLMALRLNFIFTKHNFFQKNKISYLIFKVVTLAVVSQIEWSSFSFKYKFVVKTVSSQTFGFLLIILLLLLNKLNGVNFQRVFYPILLVYFIYIYMSFEPLKHIVLSLQHWLVYLLHLLILYLNIFYFSSSVYSFKESYYFRPNPHTYSFFFKYATSYLNISSFEILKNSNLFSTQQISFFFIKKKLINFFI